MGLQEETYNHAIDYMKDELFDEATDLLEKLVEERPHFNQARWALGIAYTLSGYPHKSLLIWKGIVDGNEHGLNHAIYQVEQKLPVYIEIYQKYNKALEHIQSGKYTEASLLFEELLTMKEDIPLPVVFYQAYILTKMILGDEKNAFDEMVQFPAYVRKSLVIQDLGEEIHQYLESYRNTKEIFTDKVNRKSTILESVESWLQNILR
ncbi:tetratricopeptide repeat protein [Bacillus marasmi]|uniref:tetratricopeptide repeat protein n=1 Tax=Bacillus marasmi TaxID=1926279 RepID=UPI0011CB7983|nr:tetratricopeptide repeat protein [Bacillus marasmi]